MGMKEKGRVEENTRRDEMEEEKAEKTDNRFTMAQSRKRRVMRAEEKKNRHKVRGWKERRGEREGVGRERKIDGPREVIGTSLKGSEPFQPGWLLASEVQWSPQWCEQLNKKDLACCALFKSLLKDCESYRNSRDVSQVVNRRAYKPESLNSGCTELSAAAWTSNKLTQTSLF